MTIVTWMTARFSVKFFTAPDDGRSMVMVTEEPGAPRNSFTTSESGCFSTLLPSTRVMRSPARMPARKPGVSSIGETTVT